MIIKTILRGEASRLDGPIGEGQYGYDPNLKPQVHLQSGEGEGIAQASRLSQRRRCRAANAGGPLYFGQAIDARR